MMLFSVLVEVFKYAVAGILVLFAALYLFKPYLNNQEKFKLIEFRRAQAAQTLPMRLQAYERLILLIDRINPANMLIRLNANAYSAAELHSLIINEVRNEYQHNVTQQLYVSPASWTVAKRIKADTTNLVNNVARTLPGDATGLDLGRAILTQLSQAEIDPYDAAAQLIRADVTELF
ncbi:hypothetical protein ABZR88_22370 [Mucilaginibacter yixingensis]|nr:hypothetical protein [Mucilaginibacter yixingensis]